MIHPNVWLRLLYAPPPPQRKSPQNVWLPQMYWAQNLLISPIIITNAAQSDTQNLTFLWIHLVLIIKFQYQPIVLCCNDT